MAKFTNEDKEQIIGTIGDLAVYVHHDMIIVKNTSVEETRIADGNVYQNEMIELFTSDVHVLKALLDAAVIRVIGRAGATANKYFPFC